MNNVAIPREIGALYSISDLVDALCDVLEGVHTGHFELSSEGARRIEKRDPANIAQLPTQI